MPGDSESTRPPTEGGAVRRAEQSDDTTGETMHQTAEDTRARPEGTDDGHPPDQSGDDERSSKPLPDVEVVEPPIPERVRRPADGVRLAAAVLLLLLGLLVADLAAGTRGAVE